MKLVKIACGILSSIFITNAYSAPKIDSSRAPFHVGQEAMVCGLVYELKKFSKGTYLNLGSNYPNQHITLLIWDTHLADFNTRFGNLSVFENRRACALGTIERYRNTLQIQISNPQFLRLMK